jgi:hypothetical protein
MSLESRRGAPLKLPARLPRLALVVFAAAWLPASPSAAQAQTPFSFGAHFAAHRMPEQGQVRAGYGFRATYAAYLPFVSGEAELNVFPTTSGGDLGETQAFFGVKFGKHIGRWGGFIKFRPGLTHFGGGAFPQRLTGRTHFALDMGGGVEFDVLPRVMLRLDASDVRIYYGDAALRAAPAAPPGPALGTRDTFQTTFGVVLNF